MIPQVLNIGPLPINSFGLMIALALCACIIRLSKSFENNGINPELAEKYTFTAVLVGLLGSRVFYIIEYYDELKHDLVGAVFSSAGFTFYGGFILATLVVYIMAKKDRLSLASFFDATGPTLALGYAIGRLGCQLSGDGDYGVTTNSWLGMSYSTGVIPTAPGVFVFPTPLYESAITLGILFVLLRVEKAARWQAPYKRFGLYCSLMAIERFFIEFLRMNPRYAIGFSEAQYIAIVIFCLGTALLLCAKKYSDQEELSS